MKKTILATDQRGQEILVDPNDFFLNEAGTNMFVACHPEKNLDRGDRRPRYFNFHHIKFDPSDREEIEKLFTQRAAEQAAKIKIAKKKIRSAKKNSAKK